MALPPPLAAERRLHRCLQADVADARWATDGQQIEAWTRLLAVTYYHLAGTYTYKHDLDHAIADFDQALKLAETYTGAVAPLLAKARQGLERVQVLLAKRSYPGVHTDAPPR